MNPLLVILILFSDPSSEPLAKGLGDELARIGGEQVQVVTGKDAAANLETHGVKVGDLVASPNIADHLTADQKNLVVILVDRQERVGDVVVESRMWLEGRSDRHVAIAGSGGDPLPSVVNGVVKVIGHRLPGQAGEKIAPGDEARLASLAEHDQWLDMLGQLAGVDNKSPRQFYYQVLAYSQLQQRDAAVEALNRMREKHPKHFLIAAAEEVIPPAPQPKKKDDPADDGDTLRDITVPTDDGSNTLRDEPTSQAQPAKKPDDVKTADTPEAAADTDADTKVADPAPAQSGAAGK